jgi:hypothetical protein
MSTSGSTNFSQNRNQIISDSLQLIGAIGANDTASANDITFCSNLLNKMIKAWQGQGIHLWKEAEGTITIVADQYLYTLNSTNYPTIGRPLNIINCRYKYSSGLERKMKKMGRSEYMSLPTKTTSEGACTAFYYSPQLSDGYLYVWPVPQDTTDSLAISYIKTIEDFDNSTDDPDFPSEWLDAITYNLAVRIAPAYGISLAKTNPDIMAMAASLLADMQAWDSEEGSVRIVPNYRHDQD